MCDIDREKLIIVTWILFCLFSIIFIVALGFNREVSWGWNEFVDKLR